MKIAILQSDIAWAQPERNRQHLDVWLDSMARADLYVLPEMFSTGFAIQPEGIA